MELQRQLVDQLVAYWEWDVPTGREYWSSLFYELLGYARDEITATYTEWETRLHPDDRQRVLEAVESSLSNHATYHIDYRLLCKDETYKWVRAQGAVIFDDIGNPLRMAGTIEDISDLYAQKMMLEQANQQLRQFAHAASHDLQEPLRVIQGYARLLNKMHLNIDQDANNYIQSMAAGARRMEEMIDGLLVFSRITRDEQAFEVVSMDRVYHDTIKALQQQIHDAGATVTTSGLPEVKGIRGQLQQLVQNLISNAVKFRKHNESPEIWVNAEEREDGIYFRVVDNGVGIEPAQSDRIFCLFKQLHPQGLFPGQGVGLALCKQIVEKHGGRIWVESELGVGSIFNFVLAKP